MNYESFAPKNEITLKEKLPDLSFDTEIMMQYYENNLEINRRITELDTAISIIERDEKLKTPLDDILFSELLEKRNLLHTEKIATQANYPGDWTNLLKERTLDPVTKEKFIRQRTEALDGLKTGEVGRLDKPKRFSKHYLDQIKNYNDRVESIFNKTNVGTAQENDARPYQLGIGNINQVGTVFYDASLRDGTLLTVRQKNIIEAHEKGHGLRDFTSSIDTTEIQRTIDKNALKDLAITFKEKSSEPFPYNYICRPEEIIERMAQLKNYFGMNAREEFTKEHLDYARKHYILDTQLDNLMSEFLACITPTTENNFLSVINNYSI